MRFVPDEPATPLLWQVCFVGHSRSGWWEWFLRPGHFHVFVLGYVRERDCWLKYDVSCFKTEITLLSAAQANLLLKWALGQGGVLTWPACGVRKRFAFRFGFWCVPAVKHVLGLRCVAMTPKGLHDYLLRKGAKPLIEDSGQDVRFAKTTTGTANPTGPAAA